MSVTFQEGLAHNRPQLVDPPRGVFLPLEPCTEPLSAVLERTAHLLAEDHGDVTCGHCGAHRTIGRRAGDGGSFVCLAGCKS